MAGQEAMVSLLQLGSEVVAHDLNQRRRPCLRGRRAAQLSIVAFATLLFTLVVGNSLSQLHAFLSGAK